MLRGSKDKLLSMSAIALGHVPLGNLGLVLFETPNAKSLIYV